MPWQRCLKILAGVHIRLITGLDAVLDRNAKSLMNRLSFAHVLHDLLDLLIDLCALPVLNEIIAVMNARIHLHKQTVPFLCPSPQLRHEKSHQRLVVVIHDRTAGNIHHRKVQRQPFYQHQRAGHQRLILFYADDGMSPVFFHLCPIRGLQ